MVAGITGWLMEGRAPDTIVGDVNFQCPCHRQLVRTIRGFTSHFGLFVLSRFYKASPDGKPERISRVVLRK